MQESWKREETFEENEADTEDGTERQVEGGDREGRWRRGKKRMETKGRQSTMTVGFWNVAGLKGKGEEFWEEVEKWDIITLLETWMEEKDWCRIKKEYGR